MNPVISLTPPPPYYAVIFTSEEGMPDKEYDTMSERMEELATRQKGYLGIESARSEDGVGITVSYWQTEEDIRNWKKQTEHLEAQQKGREKWYKQYSVRVCKVERAYQF